MLFALYSLTKKGRKMKRKLVFTIVLTMVFASAMSVTLYATQTLLLSTHYWYVDWRYPGSGTHQWIQDAINDPLVADGDVIRVVWGSGATPYTERVNVTKSVTIEGYNSIPIVDGGGKGSVFNVTAGNVTLSNLIIQNGSYGINLFSSATNSNITSNSITKNIQYGIYVASQNNTIKENNFTDNGFGMSIHSSGNFLRNNNMTVNTYNFRVVGSSLSSFIQDIDPSNTVDGKPIYYWINQQSLQIPFDAGHVTLVNCTNITVENVTLSNNYYGAQLVYTSYSTIENVEVSGNFDGINLLNTTDSSIENVNASYNDASGIGLENSEGNLITNNIMLNNTAVGVSLKDTINNFFIGNTIQNSYAGIQTFDSQYNEFYHNNIKNSHLKPQVVGASFFEYWDNGAEGNYWSDYKQQNPEAQDADGDGIWDKSYKINEWNYDEFPLVKPWMSVRIFNVARTVMHGTFKGYNLTVHSNHVIASLNFTRFPDEDYPRQLSLNITAGSSGFINITIPRAWLDGPFMLWINNIQTPINSLKQNATHSSLYFTYTSGKHQVKIVGIEFGAVEGDLNGDGKVDIKDIALVAIKFGEGLPPNLTPTDITEYDP